MAEKLTCGGGEGGESSPTTTSSSRHDTVIPLEEGQASSNISQLSRTESGSLEIRRRLRKRKVNRLEKKLEIYSRKIKEMMESEVTLDEMNTDTSAYLKEDVLKIKFMNTWYELCNLLNISYDIQLNDSDIMEPYSTTPYDQLNRRIDRLLALDNFPDYWDIVKLIERVNTKHSLGIEEKEKLSLSQTVFQEVGERIKSIREKTWRSLFGCHLTDHYTSEDDPALKEPVLLEILTESVDKGKRKLNEVLDEYAIKQDTQGQNDDQSSHSTSDSDSSDREEERQVKRLKLTAEGTTSSESKSETVLSDDDDVTCIKTTTINGDHTTTNEQHLDDDDIIIVQLTDTEHSDDNADDSVIILSD